MQQDIVEFLNIKVQEYERQISALEDSIRKLEKDKSESEAESKQTLEKHIEDSKQEIDHLSIQCAKYKHELDQLAEFRGKKVRKDTSLY